MDGLRFVVVSPEMLVAVVVLGFGIVYPEWAFWISRVLVARASLALHLAITAPIGMLAAGLTLAFKVVFPLSGNRALTEWSDYPRLRARVLFALILLLGGVGCGIVAAMIAEPGVAYAVLLLLGILPGTATLATLVNAALEVRALAERLPEAGASPRPRTARNGAGERREGR